MVRDCPHYMDVRQLTSEQWEKLIEDLLALKDTVETVMECLDGTDATDSLEEKDFA